MFFSLNQIFKSKTVAAILPGNNLDQINALYFSQRLSLSNSLIRVKELMHFNYAVKTNRFILDLRFMYLDEIYLQHTLLLFSMAYVVISTAY